MGVFKSEPPVVHENDIHGNRLDFNNNFNNNQMKAGKLRELISKQLGLDQKEEMLNLRAIYCNEPGMTFGDDDTVYMHTDLCYDVVDHTSKWKNFDDERTVFIQIWHPATCQLEEKAYPIVLQAMPQEEEENNEDNYWNSCNNHMNFKQTHHSVKDLVEEIQNITESERLKKSKFCLTICSSIFNFFL